MPKLPKDCGYKRLLVLLNKYNYIIVRQKGSHIRLYSEIYKHSITIPAHSPIKIGTLNNILSDIANRTGELKENLIIKL